METNEVQDSQVVGTEDVGSVSDAIADAKPAAWKPDIANVRRKFFSGAGDEEEMENALAYAAKAAEHAGMSIVTNYTKGERLPKGYGLATLPVDRKGEKGSGSTRVALGFIACPTPELVLSEYTKDETVREFVHDLLVNTFLNKAANSLRPRSDGTTAASIPFSLNDFVTSMRPQTTAVWSEIAPPFIKAIREKNAAFKRVTLVMFRHMAASADYAQQVVGDIPQEQWVALLKEMAKLAAKKNLQTEVFEQMIRTRDTATFSIEGGFGASVEELVDI